MKTCRHKFRQTVVISKGKLIIIDNIVDEHATHVMTTGNIKSLQ